MTYSIRIEFLMELLFYYHSIISIHIRHLALFILYSCSITRVASNPLESSVSTINDQLRSSSVLTGIRTKVDDSTLEVGWVSHSAHGDSVQPFISENRVGIKDNC
jgi:hypothetical protein